MRLLVTGGREYDDAWRVRKVLQGLDIAFGIEVLIHGGARGADSLADDWWFENEPRVKRIVERPDYDRYPPRLAPLRRNDKLFTHSPDLVVAFPGGGGTAYTVRKAKSLHVPVIEVKA